MTWFIHREKRFDKELDLLKTQGEKAQVAAKRVEVIIAKLTEKGWTDLKHIAKLADHGEHRVDGCIKYDIGGGFRLVCFKRADHLYLSFVGTHDDCHRWLNRNKSRHNQVGKREALTTVVEKMKPEKFQIREASEKEWDYEEQLMAQVDEKMLRKIFGGIWDKKNFNESKVEGECRDD